MRLRYSALLLAFLMLASSLFACIEPSPELPDITTESPSVTDTPTTEAITTEDPSETTSAPAPEGICLNGELLESYTVVIPSSPTVFEAYAAEFFVEMIEKRTGIELTTVSDASAETEAEILVGSTARDESSGAAESGKYSLFSKNEKIVALGDCHLVGAGLYELASHFPEGTRDINVTVSESPSPRAPKYAPAKSAILMIGDGMGLNTVEMAKANRVCPEFFAEALPVSGRASTFNVLNQTTDSAASATALATGIKTINGYIGVDRNAATLKNVRELAYEKGAKTAILTTDAITGATPSAFLAHHTSRNDTSVLQSQINALTAAKKVNYCRGSLGDELLASTKEALALISDGDSAFFMMLEEGYIDKNSHSNNAAGASLAVRRFNDSIAYCMAFTVFHPDTVLIVTADHETGGIQNIGGKFTYTTTSHTSAAVPVYAVGTGTEVLGRPIPNTDIAKFLFSIFK